MKITLSLQETSALLLLHTDDPVAKIPSNTMKTYKTLETTTFSSQSATILVASLLLYVVFFDLNTQNTQVHYAVLYDGQ